VISATRYTDPADRVAFGLQDKFNNALFPRMFNFGLPNDFALGVGSYNNNDYKPETALGYRYASPPYDRPACFTGTVTNLPEATIDTWLGHAEQPGNSRKRGAGLLHTPPATP